MRLGARKLLAIRGMTLAEVSVAVGIGTVILAGFTTASVALQRSFIAVEDYSKGLNDQMRISDYLAMDMRRAYSIALSGSCASPPLTVTLVIPNFYAGANTPNDPKVSGVNGWPYKKHHHHKHQNVILNQVVDYGSGATTKTVVYTFDNQTSRLYRCVNGAQPGPPNQPDPPGVTTIATDVKDFCVTVNDLDETATTSITFQPRFRTVSSTDAITGTTYFQTTLTRNTR